MLSFDYAFKKVFGESFSQVGFTKINSRQPYLVRQVGDEIIHIITYSKEPGNAIINGIGRGDYAKYDILCGVASVFRKKIDLSVNPKKNFGWLSSISKIYQKSNPYDFDNEFRCKLFSFPYKIDDEEVAIENLMYSVEMTKTIILPALDKITSIESFIEYHCLLNIKMFLLDGAANYDGSYNDDDYKEGLLYIKTDKYSELMNSLLEKELCRVYYQLENGLNGVTADNYDQLCNNVYMNFEKINNKRNIIIHDSEIYQNTIETLDQRKKANTAALISYGLDL